MKNSRFLLIAITIWLWQNNSFAQNFASRISGDFYLTNQYYIEDDEIDATKLPGGESIGINSALTLNYNWKNLSAGIRYEAYLPPLLGFERQLEGNGLTNIFATYQYQNFEFTLGNFYEQFGSGMALRAYYEPDLGIDNSIFGTRIKYFSEGFNATLLQGRNRKYFEKDDSNLYGIDLTFSLDHFLKSLAEKDLSIDLGIDFVHKREENTTGLNLPSNSTVTSFKSDIRYKNFNFGIEYGQKSEEPHSLNEFSEENGKALFLSGGYSIKGFGVNIYWKYLENMFFRSDRESLSNITSGINYLPPNSNVNTNRLTTLYPYAVQGNGENGINIDLFYNIKKGTPLGGKYGTKIATDFSYITSPKGNNFSISGLVENPEILAFSDSLYYANWNVEISKRVNRKLNYSAGWSYINYNREIIEGIPNVGFVKSLTFFTDITLRLPKRKFIRTELQHMSAKQHFGNWAYALVEYGWSPKLSTYISDEWNYTNEIHYYSFGFNYKKKTTTVGLSYVRERAGLICVGGICRFVPASNGVRLQVNTTF